MTILDLCSYLGLAAVGTATLNMLLGLLIALGYSPVRLWPHCPINIFRLHNWTAYIILLLPAADRAASRCAAARQLYSLRQERCAAFDSPVQPRLNTVGAIGLDGLLIVIVISIFRLRMARPLWKKPHSLVFPACVFMFFHSMFADPLLSERRRKGLRRDLLGDCAGEFRVTRAPAPPRLPDTDLSDGFCELGGGAVIMQNRCCAGVQIR
jgi:predicted ferric reductase